MLGARKLHATISVRPPKETMITEEQNDQALHYLRLHLCAALKNEYIAKKSARALWTALKERFEDLEYTIPPQAEQQWIHPHLVVTRKAKKRPPPKAKAKAHPPSKKGKAKLHDQPYGEQNQDCFKCGLHGHWSRQCKEPQHVIDAYQAQKRSEVHLAVAQEEAPPAVLTPAAAPIGVEVPMEIDAPVLATVVSPPLDLVAAAAVLAEEEKMTPEQISKEINSYFVADSA